MAVCCSKRQKKTIETPRGISLPLQPALAAQTKRRVHKGLKNKSKKTIKRLAIDNKKTIFAEDKKFFDILRYNTLTIS